MTGVALIEPLVAMFPPVSGHAVDGRDNLASPSPREVARFPLGTTFYIGIDLGSAATFDSLYVNSLNAPDDMTWQLFPADAAAVATGAAIASGSFTLPGRVTSPNQLLHLGGDATGRYWVLILSTPGAALALDVGVVVLGKRIVHPYALGWGRQPVDTSRRTDLIDGGFGFDDGVTKAAIRWRFIDLDDVTRDALWAMFRRRGNRLPVVMVENVAAAPMSAESVHYGIFDRFEPWERANPAETQWALSLTEWR